MKQLGRSIRRSFWLAIVLVVAAAGAGSGKAAEPIKIGLLNLPNGGPVFIAEERGYFAAEGLDPTLVYFEGGQPIAVAAAGHAIDFGITGLTAGLYSPPAKARYELSLAATTRYRASRARPFLSRIALTPPGSNPSRIYRDIPSQPPWWARRCTMR